MKAAREVLALRCAVRGWKHLILSSPRSKYATSPAESRDSAVKFGFDALERRMLR